MLAVTRLRPVPVDLDLASDGAALLRALASRDGFRRGRLGRAIDDGGLWVLVTEWDDVGSYRRGLSGYDVKMAFAPLMPHVVDEPGAYAVVVEAASPE